MNPMNRKMFRDPMASRQAAGILASSPELMAAAQRRQPVRMANGGALDIKAPGNFTLAVQKAITMGDRAALQELAKPINYGQAARTQDGKTAIAMAMNALAAPKAVKARVQEVDPVAQQSLSDIMSGIIKQSQDAISREGLIAGPFAGALSEAEKPSSPRREASIDVDPSLPGPSTADGVTMSDDEMQAAMQQKAVDTPMFGGIRRAITDFLTGDLARDGETMMGMPDESSGLTVAGETLGPGRVVTPKTSPVSVNPATQVVPGDEALAGGIPLGVENARATLGRDPDPVEAGEGEKLASVVTPPVMPKQAPKGLPKVEPEVTETEESQPILTPESVDALSTLGRDPDPVEEEAAALVGGELQSAVSTIMDSDDTDKNKAKATDALFGVEDLKARKEMLKSLLGEKAKDIRTDANYNLIMTGLMIAAGQSPNALANIAIGAAKGLKGYGEAKGEEVAAESKEDRALTLAAYQDVRAERVSDKKAREAAEAAEKTREFQASESALSRAQRAELTNKDIQSRLDIANMNDDTRRWISEQSDKTQRTIAGLNIDARKALGQLNIDSAEKIASLPSREIQGLLSVFGTPEEVETYLEAKNSAKSASARQGSTITRQVEDILGNAALVERIVEDIEDNLNLEVTPALLVDGATKMAKAIPSQNITQIK